MSSRLQPYRGSFPTEQENAERHVHALVEAADGRLTSRQALAVLRVAIDGIEQLAQQVEALTARIQDLEDCR